MLYAVQHELMPYHTRMDPDVIVMKVFALQLNAGDGYFDHDAVKILREQHVTAATYV
jgi:hypothetical protein